MRHWTHQALLRCEISEFFSSLLGASLVHVDLLQMPFASYMTTNFDPCLEVAGERTNKREVQVWPEFTSSYLRSGDIFYLHGKVPRKGQKCKLTQIRVTKSDYEEAYEKTKFISNLITQAIAENHVLVFIGYGLREPAIKEVLKTALRHKKTVSEHVQKYGIQVDTGQMHFALIPENEIPDDEVTALFQECQVQIVEFPVTDNGYEELDRLVDDLRRRTVQITPPSIRHFGELSVVDSGDLR